MNLDLNYEGLWPHQERGLRELVELIRGGAKRICVVSPTGGGKSRMMRTLIEAEKSSVLYTNRKMLFNQLCKGLDDAGINYGKRASGHDKAPIWPTQICMLQTEISAILEHGARDVVDARVVHIDEVHNNCRGRTEELLDSHSGVLIGWTATPVDVGHMFDELVIAGTNSELRECGSHVPAVHFAMPEVDEKVIGKISVGQDGCGIQKGKRKEYVHRIFGDVIDNLRRIHPELHSTILFGPDVAGSIWLCEQLNKAGISAAHIDGSNCWLDGELLPTSTELRDEIVRRHEAREINVICNRYVMREGIDLPYLRACVFATSFGSITSYLQAGGRVIRNHPDVDFVKVLDHGGNWHRHGSLNENRLWHLGLTNSTVAAMRTEEIQEGERDKQQVCPSCSGIRGSELTCPWCGHEVSRVRHGRPVRMATGKLISLEPSQWRKRKVLDPTQRLLKEWKGSIWGNKKNHPHRTAAQVYANFARTHDWKYPDRSWPWMPKRLVDFYLPIGMLKPEDFVPEKGEEA